MKPVRILVPAVLLLLAAALLFVGCAKKEPPAPTPAPAPAPAPQPNTGWTPEAKPPQSLEVSDADAYNRQGVLKAIHFDTDKYDIRAEDRQILKDNAAWLLAHPKFKLAVEGHCDERNTESYNLALGERRANAAKEYLIGLGIPAAKVQTVSFGKGKPVCLKPSEECWGQNRRCEFVLSDDK